MPVYLELGQTHRKPEVKALAATALEAWHRIAIHSTRDRSCRAQEARNAILDFQFASGVVPSFFWFKMRETAPVASSVGTCNTCGRTTYELSVKLTLTAIVRQLGFCLRCGEVRDVHQGTELSLQLDKSGTLRLIGRLPSAPVSGMVTVQPFSLADQLRLDWPVDKDGTLLRRLQLHGVVDGPFRIIVVFILGEDGLAAFGAAGRGPIP